MCQEHSTDNKPLPVSEQIKNAFNHKLNSHGYGFQYAVVSKAKEVCDKQHSAWTLAACEFPVMVNEQPTHIDFILQTDRKSYYLVAECKRTDPKFSNWCFITAPFTRGNSSGNQYTVEYLQRTNSEDILKTCAIEKFCSDMICHIGVSVKDHTKTGEGCKSESDAIEDAASQVCKGMNGLMITALHNKDRDMFSAGFLPVIFTTAKLWKCSGDLGASNLSDGKIDLTKAGFEQVPWVLFQYNVSPRIKHNIESCQSSAEFSHLLWIKYTRTIPIVNAEGIERFLKWFNPQSLFH